MSQVVSLHHRFSATFTSTHTIISHHLPSSGRHYQSVNNVCSRKQFMMCCIWALQNTYPIALELFSASKNKKTTFKISPEEGAQNIPRHLCAMNATVCPLGIYSFVSSGNEWPFPASSAAFHYRYRFQDTRRLLTVHI